MEAQPAKTAAAPREASSTARRSMGVVGGIKTNQSQNEPNGIPNKAGTTKLHAAPLCPPAQAISSPASTCPRRRLNLAPMTLKITVYSKSACPQCESAKSLLKARSLPYEEIKIDDEAERQRGHAQVDALDAKRRQPHHHAHGG